MEVGKQMYTTEELDGLDQPHVMRVSFELPYLDWCKFNKSKLWHELKAYLKCFDDLPEAEAEKSVHVEVSADSNKIKIEIAR